jgi:hypothetical protein
MKEKEKNNFAKKLLDVEFCGINFCYFTQLLLNEIFVNYLYNKIYTFDKHESIFSI